MKIAIASGKGGTGKTTLSTNLAEYLAKDRRIKNLVLADLDVEEPNSGLFIKGELLDKKINFKNIPEWNSNKCTSCGNCGRVCNFNAILKLGKTIMVLPELCHSCYACSELCPSEALPMIQQRMGETKRISLKDYTFIESRLDIGQEQAVPLIAQCIDEIEEKFSGIENSLVIIDSPPGTSCPVIEVCKNADFVILITEPTPFGLHDLSLAVNTMREIKKDFAVVINKYGLGNNDVLEYCKKEEITMIAKLPNDRKIAEVYSRGGMIYEHIPAFKKELAKISAYIEKKVEAKE